jgi:hypothetical protein
MESVVTRLERLASIVEDYWAQSALAGIENDDDIGMCPVELPRQDRCSNSFPNVAALESREVVANIWTILRTLLFTTIMLLQSILSTITYSQPVTSHTTFVAPNQSSSHSPTHSSLALSTLHALSHLSFVITKFGGLTSTSSDGLAELKKVFYSSLDVLSADVEASETLVRSLNVHGGSS